MLKKLLIVAMVATTMLGGVAWGASTTEVVKYDGDVFNITNPPGFVVPDNNTVVSGRGTGVFGPADPNNVLKHLAVNTLAIGNTSADSRLGLNNQYWNSLGVPGDSTVTRIANLSSLIDLKVGGDATNLTNGIAAFGVTDINFNTAPNPLIGTLKDFTDVAPGMGYYYIGAASVTGVDAAANSPVNNPDGKTDALLYVDQYADVLADSLSVSGVSLGDYKAGTTQVDGVLRVLADPVTSTNYTTIIARGGRLYLTADSETYAGGGIDIGDKADRLLAGNGASELAVQGTAKVHASDNGIRFSRLGHLTFNQTGTDGQKHTLDATDAPVIVDLVDYTAALFDNTKLTPSTSSGELIAKTLQVKTGIVNMGGNFTAGSGSNASTYHGQNKVTVLGKAELGVEGSGDYTGNGRANGTFVSDGSANTFFQDDLIIHGDGLLTGSLGAVVDGTKGKGVAESVLTLDGGRVGSNFYGDPVGAGGKAVLNIVGFDRIDVVKNSIVGSGLGDIINASTIAENVTDSVLTINMETTHKVGKLLVQNTKEVGAPGSIASVVGVNNNSWLEVVKNAEDPDSGKTLVVGKDANNIARIAVNSYFQNDAEFDQYAELKSTITIVPGPIADQVKLGTEKIGDVPGETANLIFKGGVLDGSDAVAGADNRFYGWTIHNAPEHNNDDPSITKRSEVQFLGDIDSTVKGNINATEVNTYVNGDVVFDTTWRGGTTTSNYDTFNFTQADGNSFKSVNAGRGDTFTVSTVNKGDLLGGYTNVDFNIGGEMTVDDMVVESDIVQVGTNVGNGKVRKNGLTIRGDTIYNAGIVNVVTGNVDAYYHAQYNTPNTTIADGNMRIHEGASFNSLLGDSFVTLVNPNRSLTIDYCATMNVMNDVVVRNSPNIATGGAGHPYTEADGKVVVNGLQNAYGDSTLFAGTVNYGANSVLRLSEQLQVAYNTAFPVPDLTDVVPVEVDPEAEVPEVDPRSLLWNNQLVHATTSITGAYANNLSNNADGAYYSLFGTYNINKRPEWILSKGGANDIDKDGNKVAKDEWYDNGHQVIAIDNFLANDFTNRESNIAQLNNMGYNTGAMSGDFLTDLGWYTEQVDANGGRNPSLVTDPDTPSHVVLDADRLAYYNAGKTPEGTKDQKAFARWVDRGIAVPGWGNSTSSMYNPLATDAYNLHMGVMGAIADGSGFYKVDTQDGNIISGYTDKSLLDYFNGASIGNVLMANWRTAMQHENLSLDRIYKIRSTQRGGGSAARVDECGMPVYTCGDYRNDFWVAGVGQWDNASDSNGFDGYKYHSYGFAVGYEHKFNDTALFGASFMYTKGDYEDKEVNWDNSRIHNYSGNVYLSAKSCSGVFGTLLFGYTNSDNKIDQGRGRQATHESYDTNTWNFLGQVGYDAMVGDNFMLTPSIGVGYLNATAKGHDGSFAGKQMFGFDDYKYDTWYIPLEVRANYNVCITSDQSIDIGAKAGIAYLTSGDAADGVYHSYGIRNIDTGNFRSYKSVGRDYGHWNAMAGAGIQYNYKKMWVGLDYQWSAMKDFHSHDVNITAGIKF